MTKNRYLMGILALFIGCVVNYFGDRLLGVQIELFRGLQGFGGAWFADMFILPFFVGAVVAALYGKGGKWLCYFPPLFVRLFSYYEISHMNSIPVNTSLIPMGWWGFFVLLVVESAALGGLAYEFLIKNKFGKNPNSSKNKDSISNNESDVKT